MAKAGAKGAAKGAAKAAAKPAARKDDRAAFAARPETTGKVKVAAPQTGAEYLASLSRRPRGLHLRRARQGRDHASGVPQHRAHDGAAVRRAARSQAQGQDPAADRHRQRRHDPRLLQGAEDARGDDRRARRDRRMGEAHLRLDGPRARLQGGVPGHARRQRRVLRAVPGQREALVQVQPGARALRQPRDHPSAGRPRPAAERGRRRLLPRREGDRRRHRSCRAPRWSRPARC